MSLYAQFGTDEKKEAEGIWVAFAPNNDKSVPAFLLKRAGRSNTAYTKRLEAVTKPQRRLIDAGLLDAKASEALTLEAWVGTVLVDWRHVQGRDGKVIKFSKDAAIELMKELPELFDELWSTSNKAGLFRPEAPEADAKN